jgi:hypothetical protein
MVAPLADPLADIPADLLQAVVRNAERDAHLVGRFLTGMANRPGCEWLANRPLRLPAHLLLGLAAGLRLGFWEHQGFHVHRDAGLPPAREVLHEVFALAYDPEGPARMVPLVVRVNGLARDSFAWAGRLELNADVVLGPVDDDATLEALADFLWNCRSREAARDASTGTDSRDGTAPG